MIFYLYNKFIEFIGSVEFIGVLVTEAVDFYEQSQLTKRNSGSNNQFAKYYRFSSLDIFIKRPPNNCLQALHFKISKNKMVINQISLSNVKTLGFLYNYKYLFKNLKY